VTIIPRFESAWSIGAESDLELNDYSRRKSILRRQKIVYISSLMGWHFLKYGQSISTESSILVGISLNKRRDFEFLDYLRAHTELWYDKEVFIFHIEKPYVLPLPGPIRDTPVLAVFRDHRVAEFREGAMSFEYINAPKA
jgi:hypothetical protein